MGIRPLPLPFSWGWELSLMGRWAFRCGYSSRLKAYGYQLMTPKPTAPYFFATSAFLILKKCASTSIAVALCFSGCVKKLKEVAIGFYFRLMSYCLYRKSQSKRRSTINCVHLHIHSAPGSKSFCLTALQEASL
jgi:hypothetical protein